MTHFLLVQIPPTRKVVEKSELRVFYPKTHFQPILLKKYKKYLLNLNKPISQSKTPIK